MGVFYFCISHLLCCNVQYQSNVNVSLYTANNYVTPTIQLPKSHFREQETDQIVVRAEIISPTAHAFGSWHHGNISYIDAIEEDPFCDSDVEVSNNMYSPLAQWKSTKIEAQVLT